MTDVASKSPKLLDFCGLSFWNDSVELLIDSLRSQGGYVVVPAAPSFADIKHDQAYGDAMHDADFAIIDSGYMAIMMTALRRTSVNRISGLQLLQHLFVYDSQPWVRDAKILWVSPSTEETERINNFLLKSGFDEQNQVFYQAPFYKDDYKDRDLADRIRAEQPDLIILGIGGGKQEKLAHQLRTEFDISIPILCTGAAIAFLSGGQANIPTWADRCFLGWLYRILEDPRTFLPRYAKAAWALPLAVMSRAR